VGLTDTDRIKGRWTQRALAAVAVVLLTAVPALALTTLGPDYLPWGPDGEDGVKTAGISDGPFTFDAPAVALQKARPAAAPAEKVALLLKDWRFTQGDSLDGLPPNGWVPLTGANIADLKEDNPQGFNFIALQLFLNFTNSDLTQQQRLVCLLFIVLETEFLLQQLNKMSPHI
jgi:hypothetical protein